MSLSYVVGNLIGRALISFLLVWIVCLLASRFNARAAWQRSKRWYSLVMVTLMTLAGMGTTIITAGGVR